MSGSLDVLSPTKKEMTQSSVVSLQFKMLNFFPQFL